MNAVTKTPAIVHESERQRQFARLQIPLSIDIGGQRYHILDWSVGGFAVQAESLTLSVGNSYSGRLILPFDDFDMDVKVRFEVCYRSPETGRMGCRLVDQSASQASILQYMVRAHVAGEIVHVNDVLNLMQRADSGAKLDVPAPTARESARQKRSRRLMPVVLSVAALAILALVAMSIYERSFLISAHSAVVTSDLIQIAAPQGGRVVFSQAAGEETVAPGDLLATVTTPGGSAYFVESPCACRIVDVLVTDDSQVGVDANLFLLAPLDAATRVSALVPYDSALRLQEGMEVLLTFPATGQNMWGLVAKVDMRRQLSEIGQPILDPKAVVSAEVTVRTAEDIPLEWIGRPVAITIDTFGESWLGQIFAGGDQS